MNKLENRIRNEREAFDSFEPPGGHMDRFADKLSRKRRSLLSRIPYAVRIAAMIFLVASSSILVYEMLLQTENGNISELNGIMTELSDTEFYYTSLIREKHNAIDQFSSHDPEQNEILLSELETMDRMFKSLQKDLQSNPTDERIIHAMINHYELKLEVMGQILRQLENVKQVTKNYSYENTEI